MIDHAQETAARDRRYVWHAMSGYSADSSKMTAVDGEGSWFTDINGDRYLDGTSGLWCINVGYGRTELAQAAYDQLVKMPYFPLTRSHIPAIELGEKLNEWLDDDYTFFYSNSGSEANETAFKVARQYHQQNGEPSRWKFISRYRSYHGQTMGALAATGQAERRYKYEPLAPGFSFVAPPDMYRKPEELDAETYGKRCAQDIERAIQWEMPETVAAVIMEPLISGGGTLIPPDNYVPEVKAACERHGVLLIIDEVICGFGRTGRRFGYQHYGIRPDMVTMAKGITSAYFPLSATAISREIYEATSEDSQYERLRHVNTYGGHPAACMVALRNIQILEEEGLVDRAADLGERLREDLAEIEGHPIVGDVRNKGLLFGIELVEDKETKQPAETEKVNRVISECKDRGLIIGKNGDTVVGYNNILAVAPPLSSTDEDLSFISETLKEVIGQM